MISAVYILTLVVLCGSQVSGFDLTSCVDMTPNDIKAAAQTATPSPYRIRVTSTQYEAGVPLNVTIEAMASDGPTTFIDFLLMARCDNCTDPTVPVGTFTGEATGGVLRCSGTAAAVKAVDTNPKTSLTFTWTPPSNFDNIVIMRASVVQGTTIWWQNIESKPLVRKAVALEIGITRPPRPTTCPPSAAPGSVPADLGVRILSSLFVVVTALFL